MPYLSGLQQRAVIDPSGSEVGRLLDVVVLAREQFPPVQWAIVAAAGGRRAVPWDALALEPGHLRLRTRLEAVPAAEPPAEALWLARDILDKQIVDTHGAKVVRVNDLQLEESAGVLRLVGADVGLRGLLRRVGAEGMAERLAGVVGRRLPRGIIPWHLVERLETRDASVRLTIPHAKLALLHPADIADIVEEMSADERRAVFEQLDLETAAETLSEIEPEMQVSIVGDLDEERAADILEEMDPDAAADLLQDLSQERREELIDLMEAEEGEDVAGLLAYPADSAGGIMTTDVVSLSRDLTAGQAIDRLREIKPDPQNAYYLYVVDAEDRLDGVVSLRDLVVADPAAVLADIMNASVLSVTADTPKEEVAALIAKYDLLALPVVDARRALLGTVTIDDVVEIMLPRGWKKRSLRTIAR
ncbi:MAG TPA: CBS domain-containing protein [Candidatus Limnocylindrales bacterium]|nr:CBS domain-containing protein [Candidatus Limnocylindrales bacterium]